MWALPAFFILPIGFGVLKLCQRKYGKYFPEDHTDKATAEMPRIWNLEENNTNPVFTEVRSHQVLENAQPVDYLFDGEEKKPATVSVGDWVVVKEPFKSSNTTKIPFEVCMHGLIQEISPLTGRALVKFDGMRQRQWVAKEHFDKLEKHRLGPHDGVVVVEELPTGDKNAPTKVPAGVRGTVGAITPSGRLL